MANGYELENKTMLGGVFICLSGLLVVSFLGLHAALVGIMVLSYGDSAASIVGKAHPTIR
jgi:dolichol kinase